MHRSWTKNTPISLALMSALLMCGIGCTYEPGAPWGYLDAQLSIEPIDDSGAVTIVEQSIVLEEMQLRAPAQSTDAVGDFDPSDPPPEFTLCHQNHCHHEDGYTVSYEDIEAGIGVDSDGPVNVARRTIDSHLDLGQPASQDVEFRIVDQVSLNETALTIGEIFLRAQVSDGDETHELEITLAMATQSLSTGISYSVDRNSPERQDAEFSIQWPDDLFEDLTHLGDVIDNTTESPIAVHGTQNSALRDELVDRIHENSAFIWIEEYGEEQ